MKVDNISMPQMYIYDNLWYVFSVFSSEAETSWRQRSWFPTVPNICVEWVNELSFTPVVHAPQKLLTVLLKYSMILRSFYIWFILEHQDLRPLMEEGENSLKSKSMGLVCSHWGGFSERLRGRKLYRCNRNLNAHCASFCDDWNTLHLQSSFN